MKTKEITEGPEAFNRFKAALKTVLSVPKSAITNPAKTKKSRGRKA